MQRQTLQDVMTPNPVTLPATATLFDAAQSMKQSDIGDVIVLDNDSMCGIVTDRDIVIRGIADGRDPRQTTIGDICTKELVTLTPSDTVEDAVRLMSEKALRRLPIAEGGTPVGIVTIGDLAIEREPDSALADISEAPPND